MLKFEDFLEHKNTPWKAKRADVIEHWKELQANMPLAITPVSDEHKGTRFNTDGLRVTGSPAFINSVISRLKDFLAYENGGNKLDVEYRQVENKEGYVGPPAYVFYLHLLKDDK